MSPNHPNRKKKSAPKTAPVTKLPRQPRAPTQPRHDHERDYRAFRHAVAARFEVATRGQTRVFRTDAANLWDHYLDMLPRSERQLHDCSCCRQFINRFGGLVCLNEAGEAWPVMWDVNDIPEVYVPAVARLQEIVIEARVTGAFFTRAEVWGTPQTDEWDHLAIRPTLAFVYDRRDLSPGQAAAAIRENCNTVQMAMVDYGPAVLDEAIRVLETNAIDRSEKFLGPVRWLRKLHDWPKGRQNGEIRDRILLRAVAHAPEGYCHIKSSVMGPFLDDIRAGTPFHVIQRKHADKLRPEDYQRPKAVPTAQNVQRAEKLVETLGIEPSLHRRFARLDELKRSNCVWLPRESYNADGGNGVFAHIRPKNRRTGSSPVPTVATGYVTMTWDKFTRTVLAKGLGQYARAVQPPSEIEILVPYSDGFCGMLTAANADAPPILKWDDENERNPFSTYSYVRPQPAASWNLTGGTFAPLSAILPLPQMWGSHPKPHLGNGVVLVIEDCKDSDRNQGNALFPEILRDDLHSVRSTIEAYSKTSKISGRDDASVCGLVIGVGGVTNRKLRVRADNGAWNYFNIDRWD